MGKVKEKKEEHSKKQSTIMSGLWRNRKKNKIANAIKMKKQSYIIKG